MIRSAVAWLESLGAVEVGHGVTTTVVLVDVVIVYRMAAWPVLDLNGAGASVRLGDTVVQQRRKWEQDESA